MPDTEYIVEFNAPILVTGANGFIGAKVVETLLNYGFHNLRCLVRGSGNMKSLNALISTNESKIKMLEGNLLVPSDCITAAEDVSLVYHLAAGTEKTFAGCYMNSALATRNLLDAVLTHGKLKRLVNVSSMALYSNTDKNNRGVLDERSEIDTHPELRHEAYAYGKLKQDMMVIEYGWNHKIPYVIVRPGDVFGPGKSKISGKIGIDTFGIYLVLGGKNQIPLTYIDNCAEAIVLSGLIKGVEGEIFNIVDDNLPTGKDFLEKYKNEVKKIASLNVPYKFAYFMCYLWEKYSDWSNGQVPPVFNRRRCVAHWKRVKYSNKKIKERLGWAPKVGMTDALRDYFNFIRLGEKAHD